MEGLRSTSSSAPTGLHLSDRHPCAIAPDQVGAVEPDQRVRIGPHEVVGVAARRGRDAACARHQPRRQHHASRRRPHDQVADLAAQGGDAGVAVPGRMHAVGEQRPGHPRWKSIQTPVPVKPVWPIVPSEQASPPDQPSCRASQPRHARRTVACASGEPASGVDAPSNSALRRIEHAVDRAEQPGMAGCAPQREGVLVVHLAAQHPATPGAAFGRRGVLRVGAPREAGPATAARQAESRSAARSRCRAG